MSDLAVPSYRVRPDSGGAPWRLLALGAGVLGAVAVAAALIWGFTGSGAGPRAVPVLEADGRPLKVRPDQAGGLSVPNQDQLVLEPPAVRRNAERQDRAAARLAPESETPQLDQLRQRAAPAPAPSGPPPSAPASPGTSTSALVTAALPPPVAPSAPAVQGATPAGPAAPGRAAVQLGALVSEEAARAEWTRLQRRVPELAGRQPQVTRLERDGQPPLWRLRATGIADPRALCDAVRARGGACVPVGPPPNGSPGAALGG